MTSWPSVWSVGINLLKHDPSAQRPCAKTMLGLVMVVSVTDDYTATVGITLKAAYDAENLSGAMSLVASTGGVTLFPLYVPNMLTPNVVARALEVLSRERSSWQKS